MVRGSLPFSITVMEPLENVRVNGGWPWMELAKTRMKIVKTGSIGGNEFFVTCILLPKAKGNCQARNNLWRRKTKIFTLLYPLDSSFG